MASIETLKTIANDIAAGFETLLDRLNTQKKVEEDLRRQLQKTIEKFHTSGSDNDRSENTLSDWQEEIVKQMSPTPDQQTPMAAAIDQSVNRAKEAIKRLNEYNAPTTMNTSATMAPPKCPVAHMNKLNGNDEMEKDFTTQGKPSSLACPFAAASKSNPEGTLGLRDPIAAEFHQDSLSVQSPDDARACNKCPIRFLDKHSPEELAQYFENHKHEIPRSHEICVKRYQQDESSIRQLDAKYGNMISMIQSLGNKHKAYLPADERKENSETPLEAGSDAAVKRWVDRVDEASNNQDLPEQETEDRRESHFGKPMRSIRVGESPTRPWGISVPVDRVEAASVVSSLQHERPKSLQQNIITSAQPQAVKVEEDLNSPAGVSSKDVIEQVSSKNDASDKSHQTIFNGPVFIGYSPEQAAIFLKQLGANNFPKQV